MTEEGVDLALRLLSRVATSTLGEADGASVAIDRDGRLQTVASSDGTVARMDDHQYATGEGPCLSAAEEGRPFVIDALPDEQRWPVFVPLAMEEDIGSILSVPLMDLDQPLGSLNVYSSAEYSFGGRELGVATVLAAQAAALLIEVRDDEQSGRSHQIVIGLEVRAIIAQAQGVLMARGHLSADDASAALLRSARDADESVLERASAIVSSAQHPDEARP